MSLYTEGFKQGYNTAFGSVLDDLKKKIQELEALPWEKELLNELHQRYHTGEHLEGTRYAHIVDLVKAFDQLEGLVAPQAKTEVEYDG